MCILFCITRLFINQNRTCQLFKHENHTESKCENILTQKKLKQTLRSDCGQLSLSHASSSFHLVYYVYNQIVYYESCITRTKHVRLFKHEIHTESKCEDILTQNQIEQTLRSDCGQLI
jgi:hypothetical protein